MLHLKDAQGTLLGAVTEVGDQKEGLSGGMAKLEGVWWPEVNLHMQGWAAGSDAVLRLQLQRGRRGSSTAAVGSIPAGAAGGAEGIQRQGVLSRLCAFCMRLLLTA